MNALADVFRVLEEMRSAGILQNYAIGGARSRGLALDARLPLREEVRILLERQRQDLPLIRRHGPLRSWERSWTVLP